MVFTAYMQEEAYSKDLSPDSNDAPNVSDCWYPTIFFYDLELNKVVWEIFGAEKFI